MPASSTPEDATEILRVVRDVTGITRTQLDSRNRTITLRAPPQAAALATAIIEDLEKPRGQLILDVDILEVDRDKAMQSRNHAAADRPGFHFEPSGNPASATGLYGLIAVLEQVFGTPSSLSGLTSGQVGGLINAGQLGLGTPDSAAPRLRRR